MFCGACTRHASPTTPPLSSAGSSACARLRWRCRGCPRWTRRLSAPSIEVALCARQVDRATARHYICRAMQAGRHGAFPAHGAACHVVHTGILMLCSWSSTLAHNNDPPMGRPRGCCRPRCFQLPRWLRLHPLLINMDEVGFQTTRARSELHLEMQGGLTWPIDPAHHMAPASSLSASDAGVQLCRGT